MTKYTLRDLTREAKRAVKRAVCYACTGAATKGRREYHGWEIHLGNGSGHPALVAFYTCPEGHITQTNIAI
jgi:hypothetical protein